MRCLQVFTLAFIISCSSEGPLEVKREHFTTQGAESLTTIEKTDSANISEQQEGAESGKSPSEQSGTQDSNLSPVLGSFNEEAAPTATPFPESPTAEVETASETAPDSDHAPRPYDRMGIDELAAWLVGDKEPPTPPQNFETDVRAMNLDHLDAGMLVCSDGVCVSGGPADSRFSNSICKHFNGSMSIAMDFVGFVGEGDDWGGPFTDTAGQTYYAKYVNSREGIPASSFLMKGVRLRLRKAESIEGDFAQTPVRSRDRPGDRAIALDSISKSSHLDYPADPFNMVYLHSPFGTNQSTNPEWGYDLLSSFRIDRSPESPAPVKLNERWPIMTPFDRSYIDRVQIHINGRTAFDTDTVSQEQVVQFYLKEKAIGVIPVKFFRYGEGGNLEKLSINLAPEDEVFVDMWVRLELNARPPWEMYQPHFEHSFRVFTHSEPNVVVDVVSTGYRSPALVPHTVWTRLNRGPKFEIRADHQVAKGRPSLIAGFPVTPLFSPTMDTYELSFDRVGAVQLPSNPLKLAETMGDGWSLSRYERGFMEAIGPKVNNIETNLQLIWSDNAPRIQLQFGDDKDSNLIKYTAVYFPTNNRQSSRHHKIRSNWGDLTLDFGPSGSFDWQGETIFEVGSVTPTAASNANPDEFIQSSYPVLESYDFISKIDSRYPRFITTKFLPKAFIEESTSPTPD